MFTATPNTVKYKHFTGDGSWDSLFRQAADFAASVGPDRVINISHSPGVVAVWYRAPAGTPDA